VDWGSASLDADGHRRRPGPRSLLRLRPAQQRADPAVRSRVAPPLRGARLDDARRAGPALSLRRRPRCGGDGPGEAWRRVPRRDRRAAPALARLRLRGLAQPLPLEAGRRAGLVPLRRGRIPRQRGSDPGRAARAGRPARPATADRTAPPHRRDRRTSHASQRGALSRRLMGASLDRRRGRNRAGGRLYGGRCLCHRRGLR